MYAQKQIQNCGNCMHWRKLHIKSNKGECKYKMIWPKSSYARGSEGFRRDMREFKGVGCHTFQHHEKLT